MGFRKTTLLAPSGVSDTEFRRPCESSIAWPGELDEAAQRFRIDLDTRAE
jgi:hypothetical protein